MNNLFNTEFELSLRVAMLLSVSSRKDMTLDRIAVYDFMAIYGKYFDLSFENLHGDNDYSFSEFTARRSLLQSALKTLVLDGIIFASHSKNGFCYEITDIGRNFCSKQTTEYATSYRSMIKLVDSKFQSKSEIELMEQISSKSKDALRR